MAEAPLARTILAPSLLAADFGRLKEEAVTIERAGADWLHLDVMDGHFVPNISFGPLVLKALRPHCRLPFDVHLMIAPVDPYLADFAAAGADHINVHVEAGPHIHRSLEAIRRLGVKAGVAINPGTPASAVAPVLDLVDIILVMTVDPGFGGQKFLTSQLPKIAALRAMIAATGRPIHISVDGGVAHDTAPAARAAGGDVLIAGTAIFASADYAEALAALRDASEAPSR
jgi:ribulose-phosphate 3-epimerase